MVISSIHKTSSASQSKHNTDSDCCIKGCQVGPIIRPDDLHPRAFPPKNVVLIWNNTEFKCVFPKETAYPEVDFPNNTRTPNKKMICLQ